MHGGHKHGTCLTFNSKGCDVFRTLYMSCVPSTALSKSVLALSNIAWSDELKFDTIVLAAIMVQRGGGLVVLSTKFEEVMCILHNKVSIANVVHPGFETTKQGVSMTFAMFFTEVHPNDFQCSTCKLSKRASTLILSSTVITKLDNQVKWNTQIYQIFKREVLCSS